MTSGNTHEHENGRIEISLILAYISIMRRVIAVDFFLEGYCNSAKEINGHFIYQRCYSGSSFKNKALSILGIIALLIFLTGIAQAEDWPMKSHDPAHTGYTNESIPDDLELLWSYKTNDICSSPAVTDGKVFVGSYDNSIYCLDENNGELIWSYKTAGWVYSSPAVANEKVYLSSFDATEGSKTDFENNRIYCLDENSGELIWSYKTAGWVYSSPAVANEKVYLSSSDATVGSKKDLENNRIYCLDENNGELIWSYKTASWVYSSPAVADGKVFVGVGRFDTNATLCLDENTGNLIWRYKTNDGRIYCLDANKGNLIWSYKTGNCVYSSPAVADGKVFVGSWDNKLYCLDENTGNLIWSYETEDLMYSPAVANGKVFVGSWDNNFYCLEENTGKLIWSYETEGSGFSSPAVTEGKVFVVGYRWDSRWGPKLYCLDENTGNLTWSYETGDSMRSPVVANGKVFIGSGDGKIYCFGSKALPKISSAQSSINSAKFIGANTTEAEKLLRQANSALNAEKYEDAKQYADQAKENAEKAKTMRLTLYGIVISLITLFFIGYRITAGRRERKKRYKQLLRMQSQRRKKYRTKRKDLINKIDELINDESHISEKYAIDMLKKMRDAIAHDKMSEAEKYYNLLYEDLSQCFEFLK